MSELEELPSWAGRTVEHSGGQDPTPDQEKAPGESPDDEGAAPAEVEADADAGGEADVEADAGGDADADVDVVDGEASPQPADDQGWTIPQPDAGQSPRKSKKARRQRRSDAAAVTASPVASETPPSQIQAQPQALAGPPRRRLGLVIGLILLGVLALVGVGALGYFLAESQNSTETTAEEGSTVDQALSSDTTAADAPADNATAAGADDAEATATGAADADQGQDEAAADSAEAAEAMTVDESDATDDATDDAASGLRPINESGRQAVLRGGKVYLSGAVPSEEIGKIIEEKAAAVVGPDNVVNEYTIDPTAEIEPGESAPIYVEDVVLFPFNSVEIDPAFLPILDLGTLLMKQNPQATVTVVSRTDAVGSEEVNLEVARMRGQAVVNYWLTQGVPRSQMEIDARGEELAGETDDEETAARNRRAEFIVTGLLD